MEQVAAEEEPVKAETQKDEVNDKQNDKTDESAAKQEEEKQSGHSASKKRKTESTENVTVKQTPKRTTRNSKPKSSSHGPKEIVRFLLSENAIKILDQLESDNKTDFHYPRERYVLQLFSMRQSSKTLPDTDILLLDSLNPFQELIAACMLSKPFSHRVATRAINDLFSKTHSLTDPKQVLDFGHDKMYEQVRLSVLTVQD